MRWLNKRSLGTLLVLSVITLFLAVACTGPTGITGPRAQRVRQALRDQQGLRDQPAQPAQSAQPFPPVSWLLPRARE